MKISALIFALFFTVNSFAFNQLNDFELLNYLFSKAVKYSKIEGYNINQAPPIFLISKNELMSTVCPENPSDCDKLAAVFDDIGFRILVRDDFELTQNFKPFDYSFVIHEIIHSLQYLKNGPEIFNGCSAVFETEKLAYNSQDQYLKDEGEFFRAGIALNFFYCDEEIARLDYEKSKKHWDEKRKSEL